MNIYIGSIIHFLAAALAFFIWTRFDRKVHYHNYVKVSLLVGIPLGIAFDFTGVILMQLWMYKLNNIFEYLSIFIATYVIGTPLLIEVYHYMQEKLIRVKVWNGVESLPRRAYVALCICIVFLLSIMSFIRIKDRDEVMPLYQFLTIFMLLMLFSDSVLGMIGKQGAITRFLKGYALAPLTVILSGVVSGLWWEILNVNVRLWTYTHIPYFQILDIPIIVILLWGTLNLGYSTFTQILVKLKV